MLTATSCLFGLIAAITILEWSLWCRRQRRRGKIDAFMEWHTYPPTEGPPVVAASPSDQMAGNDQDAWPEPPHGTIRRRSARAATH